MTALTESSMTRTSELMLRMWKSMLEEFNMSGLKSSPTLRWERRENDEKEMPASEQGVCRQFVGNLLRKDRADLRCAMGTTS